jgi:hypothetical protein
MSTKFSANHILADSDFSAVSANLNSQLVPILQKLYFHA